MAARIYLSIVGLAYLAFSAWCALKPAKTADAVGFDIRPGGGQSEYFTVYGGLQFALGCLFLLPMFKPEFQRYALLSCVIIHASLVAFRAISLMLYSRVGSTTLMLAGLELTLFLSATAFYWKR